MNVDWSVPVATVNDSPRFGYRGVMIDVARYFIPKEDLLRLIDCISLLKINTLHLHLTDDNGWRIEIKKASFAYGCRLPSRRTGRLAFP